MQTDALPTAQRPVILEPGGGEHYHFLNQLATVKVSGGTEGQLSVVEFLAPRGFGPPLHRHNDEDELFVVLAGEIVLRTGGIEERCEEGGVALLPREVPHGFQVLSDEARILNVTGSSAGPPRFDALVATLGTPLTEPGLPAPVPIDPAEVAQVWCPRHRYPRAAAPSTRMILAEPTERNHTVFKTLRMKALWAAGTVVVAVTVAACGGDGATATTAAPATTTTTTGNVVEVGMHDYSFMGLPDSVPAGTRLTVVNHSEAELHELVIFKLDDDEQRSAADLAGLAPQELEATLGPPVAVLLAPPGGDQIAAVGDGMLAQPGRYVVFCFIPTGVDPQVYLEAAAQSEGGPPQIEGAGPPHFVHGMLADLVVE